MSAPQTQDTLLAADLLAAARAGDGEAFRALVAPHLRALHVHAYRMLGSLDDAEEALQDALLNAWRALDAYQGQAPLSHWLYRITSTSSLKVIRAKARRPVPTGEIGHLQPYPDRLLDQLADAGADPAAIAERRESVALAFITALQRLPARQRAALILRDVLAWSAVEVADLLEISVPAVNSSLQRARTTLAGTRGPGAVAAHPRLDDHQRQVSVNSPPALAAAANSMAANSMATNSRPLPKNTVAKYRSSRWPIRSPEHADEPQGNDPGQRRRPGCPQRTPGLQPPLNHAVLGHRPPPSAGVRSTAS